jgi:hypothetical protein
MAHATAHATMSTLIDMTTIYYTVNRDIGWRLTYGFTIRDTRDLVNNTQVEYDMLQRTRTRNTTTGEFDTVFILKDEYKRDLWIIIEIGKLMSL